MVSAATRNRRSRARRPRRRVRSRRDEAPSDALPGQNSQRLGELLVEGRHHADQLERGAARSRPSRASGSARSWSRSARSTSASSPRCSPSSTACRWSTSGRVAPRARRARVDPRVDRPWDDGHPRPPGRRRLAVVVADPTLPRPAREPATGRGATGPRGVVAPAADVRAPSTASYRALAGVDRARPRLRGPPQLARARPARSQQRGRRERAGRAGRQPHRHPGGARPRLRRAHRAAGRPGARAVPHRRRAARRRSTLPADMGPALVSRIKIMAEHEHRRAPPRRRTARSRRRSTAAPLDVRVADHAVDLGREVRAAAARQEPLALPARRARHAAGDARRSSASSSARRSAW